MPEDPAASEIDLSKIDSLLNDLEKDLPAIQAGTKPVAAKADTLAADLEALEEDAHEILGLPVKPTEKDDPPDDLDDMFTTEKETLDTATFPPGEAVAPHLSPAAAEMEEVKPEPPAATQPAAPEMVEAAHADVEKPAVVEKAPPEDVESSDAAMPTDINVEELLEMEEEEAPKPKAAPAPPEPPAAAPAVPAAADKESTAFEDALDLGELTAPEPVAEAAPPPAVPAPTADASFEDALDLMEEEKSVPSPPPAPVPAIAAAAPPATPPPPSAPPGPPPVKASIENFQQSLKDKNYPQAIQIGKTLITKNSPVALRINLAGAMYCAGQRADAEKELAAILAQNPYNIAARRNLEIVRVGAGPS